MTWLAMPTEALENEASDAHRRLPTLPAASLSDGVLRTGESSPARATTQSRRWRWPAGAAVTSAVVADGGRPGTSKRRCMMARCGAMIASPSAARPEAFLTIRWERPDTAVDPGGALPGRPLLRHLGENSSHLVGREGPQRLGPQVPQGSGAQEQGGGGLVIGGLDDGNHVIRAQGPVDRCDGDPYLLSPCPQGLRPLGRVLDVPNPLVGELPEHDVRGHDIPLFL